MTGLAGLVAEASAEWDPIVESAVFGTADPVVIEEQVIGFVEHRLGRVSVATFYLAEWMLHSVEAHTVGVFNTVSAVGHASMGELLHACRTVTRSDAELVWISPEKITEAGIAPWTQLPIWVPPDGDLAGLHSGDVSAALSHGLRCRPFADTVTDTWAWLHTEGDPPSLSNGSIGLDPQHEAEFLAQLS